MPNKSAIVPAKRIENNILVIREQKVMLDVDLAKLYGVTTKRLNEQVKRNKKRFLGSFMFRLDKTEKEEVVANCDRFKNLKHSTSLPNAFTEHGTLMAATVLNSHRAIDMSIFVIDAFVKMREMLGQQQQFARKLVQLESRVSSHDQNIKAIIQTIRKFMEPSKLKRV